MSTVVTDLKCFHCDQACSEVVWLEDKPFCCFGCKTVYEILNENDLCEYYTLDTKPGIQPNHNHDASFDFLNEPSFRKKILSFDSPGFASLKFQVPAIHCVSCIWLLENLQKIKPGVLRSEVNFAAKSLRVDFNPSQVTPGALASQLASLGYAPQVTLVEDGKSKTGNRELITKLAVAGFAFGNIMLFSFPEYLGIDDSEKALRLAFSYLNIAFAIPVILYSANDYFNNGWKSFAQKQINIDVPIAVGLLALFMRSVYDIFTHQGPGYLDSLSGLVFFLLIGRWFQDKTYESLAFDRDYKSYFPLAVLMQTGPDWRPVAIQELREHDRIKVKNLEVVPADSTLMSDRAYIDYGFVTGESKPMTVSKGELVYAGGRSIGQPIELGVLKPTSHSHLTSLWNNPVFQKPREKAFRKTIDNTARWFTWFVLGLAFVTAVAWYFYDASRLWPVLTSVLIVACPCALALAAPFTYGTLLRQFGKYRLYLKNADVIEQMATVDTVVLDKTGTITFSKTSTVKFEGLMSETVQHYVKALSAFSVHPLSKLIHQAIAAPSPVHVEDFQEVPGLGLEGSIDGRLVRLGSAVFTKAPMKAPGSATLVFVSIDSEVIGYYSISVDARENIGSMARRLGARCYALLSGDHPTDDEQMKTLLGASVQRLFNQSPLDKLQYIHNLQRQGRKVMMLGDGLNDAGALKQSDVGFAVTDDASVFNPACDGILQGDQVASLDRFLALARSGERILKMGFAISFVYNAISLSFAVTGHLTPLVAAILMPASSITVVAFSSLAVRLASDRILKVDNP